MNNERYLVVSYFICAAFSVGLGALVYLFLRRPFAGIADTLSGKPLRSTLKMLFPIGLLLPAFLGFVSVSYQSCDRGTYEQIVQTRSYLVEKNQQQISWTLLSIVIAILVWNLIILLLMKFARSRSVRSS